MSRSLVTAFASIAGSRILVIIASAVISPALVFFLTTDQFGQYGSVMAVFSLLMILVSSGINSGVRKYISEEHDDEHWKDHVFAYYFRLATALAVLAAVVLALGAYTGALSSLLNSDSGNISTYFYLLALLVVASQFREYVRRALMGLKFEHIGEPLRVIEKISFGVVAVTLAALDFGVVGVLFGLITASMLVFGVGLFFIAKEIRLSYVLKPLPDDFPSKELFHFNHLTIVYVFLLTSMYHIDVIFVQSFVGSTEAGLYKMALVLVEFLWVIPRSIQSVMIQSTSNLWVEGKIEQIQDIAAQSTRYALLITTLLALGMGALASDFVPLYYPSVESPETVVTAILLLLPGTLGFAMARPLLSINHAKGDMKALIAATGAAALINLVLNVLLIRGVGPFPELGTHGAAIATSVGYGSLPIFQVWVGRRFGYDPFADVRFPRLVATGLIAGIPIAGLPIVIGNPLVSLVVVPPVGFVVFMTAAIGTGSVRTSELLRLLSSLPEPVASKAQAVERWLDGSGDGSLGVSSRTLFSVALPVVGIIFFAIGIGFVAGVPGLPGLDGGDDSPATPGPNTSSPTPTENESLTTDSPTATPTASPDGTTATDDGGGSGETTAPPTSTPTDDSGGLFGDDDGSDDGGESTDGDGAGSDGGDDDSVGGSDDGTDSGDDTSTPTGSSTETPTGSSTETPTDSSTKTPTDSPTETPTDSPTETSTATPTETTQAETEPSTSTPTSTVTDTSTSSQTDTSASTDTSDNTSTTTE